MMNKQDKNKEEEHEERTTTVYSIKDALHELEVDLRHNAKFPNVGWDDKEKRTDVIRISGGWGAPSLIINKTQCRKWMREHFQSEPTQPSDHWAKEGQLYVTLKRSAYWIWVSCGEETTRTEWSKNALNRAEEARMKVWEEEE